MVESKYDFEFVYVSNFKQIDVQVKILAFINIIKDLNVNCKCYLPFQSNIYVCTITQYFHKNNRLLGIYEIFVVLSD